MKVKAAVAGRWKAAVHRDRRPGGAAPRRGSVEIKATGICHTDYYTLSGADPEGLFPVVLGHEGAGVVVDVSRRQLSEGRGPRHPAVHARMPTMQVLSVAEDQSLPGNPFDSGSGSMPDGTARFDGWEADSSPCWVHRRLRTTSSCPRLPLCEDSFDAPFDKVCYIGCGVTTGVGAVLFTAKVEAGANVVVFGLGGIGLNVIQAAKMVGDKIIGVDLNPAREEMARKFGMTHF